MTNIVGCHPSLVCHESSPSAVFGNTNRPAGGDHQRIQQFWCVCRLGLLCGVSRAVGTRKVDGTFAGTNISCEKTDGGCGGGCLPPSSGTLGVLEVLTATQTTQSRATRDSPITATPLETVLRTGKRWRHFMELRRGPVNLRCMRQAGRDHPRICHRPERSRVDLCERARVGICTGQGRYALAACKTVDHFVQVEVFDLEAKC